MKRILIPIVAALLILSGCTTGSIDDSKEIEKLDESVETTPSDYENQKYILVLELKQSHFTLSISEHLKDAANKMEIEIPVDKEYFDSVEIGQDIVSEFRMGSLVFKSSLGKFKVTVKDKEIR